MVILKYGLYSMFLLILDQRRLPVFKTLYNCVKQESVHLAISPKHRAKMEDIVLHRVDILE